MSHEPIIIDAIGLLCPLPVLRLRKRIKPLPQGTVVELRADDPAALIDVPHFCAQAGHELLSQNDDAAGFQTYRLRLR